MWRLAGTALAVFPPHVYQVPVITTLGACQNCWHELSNHFIFILAVGKGRSHHPEPADKDCRGDRQLKEETLCKEAGGPHTILVLTDSRWPKFVTNLW